MRRIAGRLMRYLGFGLGGLVLCLLAIFALPVEVWRTGELPAPSLPLIEGGPSVAIGDRIWIDTDAACGAGRMTDPDDCLAILLLATASGIEIAGISTVHGNADLDVTDRTTRELVEVLEQDGASRPAVLRGSATPLVAAQGAPDRMPAHIALEAALAQGPLTLVALGPLTNIAAVLHDRPDLRTNVERLIAVMGRRPGHMFHPAEGTGSGGILFGHGPIFTDFNFEQDRQAATMVLEMQLPTTLAPYEAARQVSLTEADLRRLQDRGGAAAWVASRAAGWLGYWKEEIGRDGFYPFDLLAAAYVLAPQEFDCAAEANAQIGKDRRLWHLIYDPDALLIGPGNDDIAEVRASNSVVYCPRIEENLHDWLMSELIS